MRRAGKLCMILCAVLLTSSRSDNIAETDYQKLMFLKQANPPEKIRLIMTQNYGTGKPAVADGLLFTYRSRKALKVSIAGNFSAWKPQKMERGRDGVWFFFLSDGVYSGKVEYKFNVDGLWTEDPYNIAREDDRYGSYISTADLEPAAENRRVSYKMLKKDLVVFRIYKPEASVVSLVGDFNGWNPENDLLRRGADGIWRLEKRLASGTYRYKFVVDGQWLPDVFNPDSASDKTGDICSVIKIRR
jgi:1,4-alpha-glucan branching enzyme